MPSGSFHEGVKELDGSLGASLSLMVILEGERENEKGRMIIIFWIDRLEWKHQQLTDYLVSILLHCISLRRTTLHLHSLSPQSSLNKCLEN